MKRAQKRIEGQIALFEEVVRPFTGSAVTIACDKRRDCFNCGKEAFDRSVQPALQEAAK